MSPRTLATAALSLGLLAVTASATATAATASPPAVATTSTAVTAATAWRTAPTEQHNPRALQPKVVDLRMARHAHFDRVVVDVAGRRPGLAVSYTKRLMYDGSGRPVPLRGTAKMSLTLQPAAAHDRHGDSLYTGPRLRQVSLPTLRGVALTGDAEGAVTFGFTTSSRAPYRVFTLTNPSRIVIDWQH